MIITSLVSKIEHTFLKQPLPLGPEQLFDRKTLKFLISQRLLTWRHLKCLLFLVKRNCFCVVFKSVLAALGERLVVLQLCFSVRVSLIRVTVI